MFRFILFICILLSYTAEAQVFQKKEEEKKGIRLPKYVATKNTYGMIAGFERGQYTFMELGAEKHWKKIRLVHAQTVGVNANMEYSFGNNILGYNAGAWIKNGRVDLTYGLNLNYITDFEKSRYGLGPQIGFRLLGLHFVNGYNFLLGDKELTQVNKFYVGLRYYFPLQSKTTVVNVNKRKPTDKEREKNKESGRKGDSKIQKNGKTKSAAKNASPSKSNTNSSRKKKNNSEAESVEKERNFSLFNKKKEPEQRTKSKIGKKVPSKSNNNESRRKKEIEPEKKSFWDYFRNNE